MSENDNIKLYMNLTRGLKSNESSVIFFTVKVEKRRVKLRIFGLEGIKLIHKGCSVQFITS